MSGRCGLAEPMTGGQAVTSATLALRYAGEYHKAIDTMSRGWRSRGIGDREAQGAHLGASAMRTIA